MRTPDEIQTMIDRLEVDIEQHGFDASVDAASRALEWALGSAQATMLDRYMARPDAERRQEWIARGGDPAHWPDTDSDRS